MKIIVVAPKNKTVFNFRGDLIRDMIASGNEVVVVGPNRDYIDDIMALGISEFVEVPLVKDNTSVMGDLGYYKRLKQVFRRQKPDLVFGYTIKPVIYGSIAAKSAKVPNIYAMVTGLGRVYASQSFKAKAVRLIIKKLYQKAFRACRKVIFQNQDDIKEFVAQRYLPENKCVHVNGSGVNMKRFSKADLPEQPVFLMVSRIIREKGVLEYCRAARVAKQTHPEARFILLGGLDSSIGALTMDDIKEYISDGSIEFPGEVKDPVSYYHQCSVFVLPSYYREGLPRTILEAMSCGRAVITTDWPGCRDAVINGETGFLVQPKNYMEVADRMRQLIENKDLLNQMAENAYQRCLTVYEVGIVNQSMKDIINY